MESSPSCKQTDTTDDTHCAHESGGRQAHAVEHLAPAKRATDAQPQHRENGIGECAFVETSWNDDGDGDDEGARVFLATVTVSSIAIRIRLGVVPTCPRGKPPSYKQYSVCCARSNGETATNTRSPGGTTPARRAPAARACWRPFFVSSNRLSPLEA
jgi:hypothetical protein